MLEVVNYRLKSGGFTKEVAYFVESLFWGLRNGVVVNVGVVKVGMFLMLML